MNIEEELRQFWREYDAARTVPPDGVGVIVQFKQDVFGNPVIDYSLTWYITGEKKFKTYEQANAFIKKISREKFAEYLKRGRT